MDYREFVEKLDEDVVARLRSAVETGRWPDGRSVTAEQREHSLQAVIAWEAKHLPESRRTGFIDKGRKERKERKGQGGGAPSADTSVQPLTLGDGRGDGS